jgi:hypothetical protein
MQKAGFRRGLLWGVMVGHACFDAARRAYAQRVLSWSPNKACRFSMQGKAALAGTLVVNAILLTRVQDPG